MDEGEFGGRPSRKPKVLGSDRVSPRRVGVRVLLGQLSRLHPACPHVCSLEAQSYVAQPSPAPVAQLPRQRHGKILHLLNAIVLQTFTYKTPDLSTLSFVLFISQGLRTGGKEAVRLAPGLQLKGSRTDVSLDGKHAPLSLGLRVPVWPPKTIQAPQRLSASGTTVPRI